MEKRLCNLKGFGTLGALLVLAWGTGTAVPALAAEDDQIYVLTERAVPSTDGTSPQYAFGSMGTVAGAHRLAVPENGRHILVLTQDGRVWTWGDNSSGQLGAGNLLARDTWAQVENLEDVTAIAAGALHSVALKQDGTVWTWGANQLGQLGSGNMVSRPVPGVVPDLTEVKMVAGGLAFTLALRTDGTVWAFGSNWNEIVPGEARRILMEPVPVVGLTGIQAIAVYRNRGYAKDNQGRVWVWGKSDGQQNSAVTELSGQDAAHLAARVLRQLGDGQTADLQTEWRAGLVRVAETTVEVVKGEKQSHYGFEGAVIDVDWGWAVALITAPAAVETPGTQTGPLSAPTNKPTAKKPPAVAAFTVRRRATAAAVGTLTATQTHGLVVNSSGTACGMGRNEYGELGDGTAVDRWTPVPVSGLNGVLTKVATGWYHSLGLKTDGTVWAWGYNDDGELGDGTTTDKPTPERGGGSLTGIVDVAAGEYHSVAVRNDGTVWAWGYNSNGQLGDGTTTERTTPVQVILLSGVIQVAAGQSHTLALKNDGTVWAWGHNGDGELGDGTTTQRTSAVQVTGLTGVIRIAAGAYHSLALKSDGTVWTWGYNGYGQLGDGSTTSRSSIVTASGLSSVIDIAGGDDHSLAVKNDGTVWAWGYNGYGEIGDATTTERTTPVQVAQPAGFSNMTAVAGGTYFSAALKGDGTVWAWGHNDYGQLGNGSTNDSSIPVVSSPCAAPPPPLGSVSASPWVARLTANQSHSLGVKPDGTVWAWGENEYGELGDSTTLTRFTPVQSSITGITQVATGWYHTLALRSDRTVWGWGYNSNGELGDSTTTARPTPVQTVSLTGAVGVGAGQYHSVAVKSDGTVWAWGYNGSGQLGDGTTTERTTPVQAILVTGVIQVAAGQNHSLALKNDGTVWGWGYNGWGQLGDGTTTQRTSAVQVLGLSGVIAIAAGADYSMALKSDGTVWAWGYNSYGELGDGSTSYRTTIVRASDLTGVVAIYAGQYHSMAVKSDGTVWDWGYNSYGELGDTTTTDSTVPVQVTGLSGGLAAAAGSYYSLALKNDGTIWAWGHNDEGQFGNGGTTDSTVPVQGSSGFVTSVPQTPLQFVPVTPCRIADTRNPSGPFGGPAITGGTARNFEIPNSACGIPSTAAAYSINVTVVPQGLLGYLTVWPTGLPLPLASTLNSLDGRVKANAAVVPAGTSGGISVYVTNTTDVILDINGYFVATPTASTLTFFPLTPCRIADTRSSDGPLGGPFIAAGQDRTFPVLTSSCNVPATAQAYSLNFTAVPHGSLGYITTWPTGEGRPLVSTLNAITGQVTANAAIVPAGASGQVDVFAANDTDLVIDINGYFAPSGAGGLSLYNLTPCRVLDTRNPSGVPPFGGTQSVSVAGSLCAPPGNAQAYIFSATVVPSGPLGYLTLWPQGQPQPLVSTLNALDGAVTSNMAIVPTTNGSINGFAANPTYLVLDISGYFAP
jgi:alpha-tubulin suppressor-like RCC1 family protein